MTHRFRGMVAIVVLMAVACAPTKKDIKKVEEKPGVAVGLNQVIPVDSKIKIGRFANGLTYYIRQNQKPENRAELRLAVNVGSVVEDDDQQGLAHLVEHMAFNGTKNFAKQELVDYLESIGMRFGPDINAYTSFDETVYMLQVPTDSVAIMEQALQILEDWAHQISFDEQEIDKERKVVIEEWRLGRGAEARMRDQQFPILFKDSRYAERLVIGKKAVIDTAHYDTIRRLYRDWYRPDLMAVIAVGDFDVAWIEGLVKKHFANITPPETGRERVIYPVPDHQETLFAIATDPEATSSRVSIFYKHPLRPQQTVADYRQSIVENLYNGMLNQRLEELTRQENPPFLYGFSSEGRFVRSKEVYLLGAGVRDNGINRGLEALMTEAERVRKFGFTQSELDRQKLAAMRALKRSFTERDKTESNLYASEYIRNFLVAEPIPGIEYEYELYQKLVPGIQLAEMNRLASDWITDTNRVIMINAPEKAGVTVPDQDELLAVFDSIQKKTIEPYQDIVSEQPLIEQVPAPAAVIAEQRIDTLGITEWHLANGVRVVCKPTNFKNDEVRFTSFSPGGHSLVSDQDYVAAVTAASVIGEGGVGNFNQVELTKFLTGKIVRVSPFVGELLEGISGSAAPEDLELALQLIHAFFTRPRKDSTAFNSFKTRMKGFMENQGAQPESVFEDTIQVIMAQHHHRARPWSEQLLEEMNLDESYNIYRDRFADASDFTFFFVGNFDLDQLKSLVQTYLGGLPVLSRNETWQDVGMRPPEGVITKTVRRGLEAKSQVRFLFTGPFDWKRQNRYDIQAMADVFRIKLREVIREDLGGTYGIRVGLATSRYPVPDYQVSISFGCDPGRVDELSQAVLAQIDSLKNYGTTASYIHKVQESQRRSKETALKENGFWLATLRDYYYYDMEPLLILEHDKLIDNLTKEAVQRAANQYFNMENYVKAVLLPENQE